MPFLDVIDINVSDRQFSITFGKQPLFICSPAPGIWLSSHDAEKTNCYVYVGRQVVRDGTLQVGRTLLSSYAENGSVIPFDSLPPERFVTQ
jgi:hypothetical protein